MALQRTLLERIRTPGPRDERHMRVSTQDLFDSVLKNLQKMLNTTQGNCLTDERYGLPHMSEIRSAMPHSLRQFESAIRSTVERHEPRLRGVRIRYAPDPDRGMELRFEISGMLVDEDGQVSVRFETYADDQGRLFVR